jgi:hypothetical protein
VAAEPFLAWRDVVNIPAGETVRLRFVQHLPGLRMFHCHILEHEDAGMMAMLDVKPEQPGTQDCGCRCYTGSPDFNPNAESA